MLSELVKLIFGLVPGEDATPAQQRQWRKTIGMTIAGLLPLVLILFFGMLAIFGILPIRTVDSFARSSDLKDVAHTTDLQSVASQFTAQLGNVQAQISRETAERQRESISRLRESLLDQGSKQCHAKTGEVRRLYAETILSMESQYKTLTGDEFTMPGCQDLN